MIVLLLFLSITDEAVLFEAEEQSDFEIVLKEIEVLKLHPLDLNTALIQGLEKIPFLTHSECRNIVVYREKHGSYKALEDLLKVPGFDELLVERIRPFIMIGAKPLRIDKFSSRMRCVSTMPHVPLSEEYYTRTTCTAGPYSAYLATEKDPYEHSLLDYWAGGVMFDQGKRKLIAGTYTVDVGSGVLLSSVGSLFRTPDFRIVTRERGIIPYTSVLENGGFFGCAYSDSFFMRYTLFYSDCKRDGRIDTSGYARSFDESGEHTDSLSISRKDRIGERLVGYDVSAPLSGVRISQRAYWCFYNPAFACSDSSSEFYGRQFWAGSIGLKYTEDVFVIFSEFARSFRDRYGGLFGFSGSFPFLDFNLAGTFFPVGFYSPKGIEASDDYTGGTLDLRHRSRIGHIGTTLNIDSNADYDSVKYTIALNYERKIGLVAAKAQIRWRFIGQARDLSGSSIFVRITPLKYLFFDARLEDRYAYETDAVERGLCGALELGIELEYLRVRARYGLFDTDSYASRIFVYETDLPGIINNRILYNEGEYGFVYASVEPLRYLHISAKYSIVKQDTLSTTRLGAQVDVTL